MAVEIVEAETSKCDVAETPVRRRQLWLLVLPVLFLGLYCVFVHARGPFYVYPNSDPEYAYLLNSLNIATGNAPHHIHHPGTTLQLLGGLVIKTGHIFAHGRKLAEKVLRSPERHLQWINSALAGICFAALIAAGFLIWHQTGQWFPAVVLQATPFLLGNQFDVMMRVSAEPMLLIIGVLIAVVLYVNTFQTVSSVRIVTALAFLMASATVTKVSFIPLAVIALPCLQTWKQRGWYLLCTGFFICLWLLPLVSRIREMADWVVGLTIHQGRYGRGEIGLVSGNYFSNLLQMLVENPWTLATVIMSWVALFCRLGLHSEQRSQAERWLRLLAGLALGETVQMLIVAKFAQWRYLLPTMTLCPLNVLLMMKLASLHWRNQQWWPRVSRISIASACVLIVVLGFRFQQHYMELASTSAGRAEIAQRMEKDFQNETVALIGAGSSPYYALWFGDFYAGGQYTGLLTNNILRDHRPVYLISVKSEGSVFLSGQRVFSFPEFIRQQKGFVYSGLTKHEARVVAALPVGARLNKLVEKGGEAIYRVSY